MQYVGSGHEGSGGVGSNWVGKDLVCVDLKTIYINKYNTSDISIRITVIT